MRDLFLRSRRSAFVWEERSSLRAEDFDIQTVHELKFVAVDAGRILGFISVWEPDSFIHHLHVDPELPRRGIGSALLRALPGWPTAPYCLKCVAVNTPALAFYRANQFTQAGDGHADGQDYLLLQSGGIPSP